MGGCITPKDNQIVPVKRPTRKGIIRTRKQRIGQNANPTSTLTLSSRNCQNVEKVLKQLNEQDRAILNHTISQHFLLYRLPANERNKLINCFQIYHCKKDAIIFRKHDQANMFFVVKEGEVEINTSDSGFDCWQHGQGIVLTKGAYFGDLALLYAAPRSATVISRTDCYFYCITNQIFRKIVRETIKKNYDVAKNFIQKASIFSYLSPKQKHALAYNTLLLKFEPCQVIFHEGDDANCFYIVTSGKVELIVEGKKSLWMNVGESFGENSFQEGQTRSGTATAAEETILLSIGRDSLRQCLGSHLRQVSFINILKWAFSRNQLLRQLTGSQKQTLIGQAQIREYKNKQIICWQGQKADFIVIVLEDRVNDKQTGTIFNLEYLNSQTENDMKLTTRLTKYGKGSLAVIRFGTIREVIGRNFDAITHKIPELDINNRRQQYINKITLGEIFVLRKIGDGAASKVYCVIDKYKRTYTLKVVGKKAMIQNKMIKAVMNEKFVMSHCDSPFIIKLWKTFKDQQFFYLLMNYIEGVDLYDVLKQMGPCSRTKTRLFAGCLVLALEHLHDSSIVHRDLKPQNILVDEMGYLNIVDFGVAKVLKQEHGLRTFTVTGTPHFMAPEIINVQGYSFGVDYWSLGVILYEIVCNFLPFGSETQDPYEILRQIDANDLQFPAEYDDEPGKILLTRLLSKNPFERTCGQFRSIKKMQFFEEISWGDLEKRQLKTLFKIKGNGLKQQINEPLSKLIKKQKANLGRAPSLSYLDRQF